MDLHEAAILISELVEGNKSLYLRAEPEVPDFTIKESFRLTFFGERTFVQLIIEPRSALEVAALLDVTVFDPKQVGRLYVWNFKALCSYFKFCFPKGIVPNNSIFDLKVIENFLGIRGKAPENLGEAVDRMRSAIQNKRWNHVYKAVHLPLLLKVLPDIEVLPLLNERTRSTEHPYYEIEGQIYGRMNNLKKFAKSYLPHAMGPETRSSLKPRGYNLCFVTSDFRHCEVTVLQWLSKDPKLAQLLQAGDLHRQIYETITGDSCDTDHKRDLSKLMFLPVMYGCGPKALAKLMGLPETVTTQLIHRIRSTFKVAWDWMMEVQGRAKLGVIEDYFGRPRLFTEPYKARDFVVQGVAATVCQEKLIQLHGGLPADTKIVYSVHDGLGLVTPIASAKQTYRTLKDVLESESVLCPGLRMKIEVKFGKKLDNMKPLWKD